MSDLHAKLTALHMGYDVDSRDYVDGWDDALNTVWDLIPEGTVLVTEETLAAAFRKEWPWEAEFDGDKWAAAIIAKLREGT